MATNQTQDQGPTPDQIREARHMGFANSISHRDEQTQHRLAESYGVQDARRERNITSFYDTVLGDGN